MASVRQQLSAKLSAFIYDHHRIASKGKDFHDSCRKVEKIVDSLGMERQGKARKIR